MSEVISRDNNIQKRYQPLSVKNSQVRTPLQSKFTKNCLNEINVSSNYFSTQKFPILKKKKISKSPTGKKEENTKEEWEYNNEKSCSDGKCVSMHSPKKKVELEEESVEKITYRDDNDIVDISLPRELDDFAYAGTGEFNMMKDFKSYFMGEIDNSLDI